MSAKKKYIVDDNYLSLIFYLTLPLLLLPPFFRGLFFDYEFSVGRIYAGLVLMAYVFMRRDRVRLSRNIMDYAWLGLLIAYITANFVALNQRAALEGVLRYFTFFVIYWLLANTVKSLRDFKTAFAVLFTAGVGVALAGLGTAFGTFSFNGAFSENMILSTLQYHNAAAIFLIAAGVTGLYLTASVRGFWWRIAIGGLNYVVIATAYGAGSRGAMLAAPAGFILLLAGMPRQYRFKVFVNFISVLIPFIVTAKQVLDFNVYSEGYYWGWLLVGILLACGCQFLVEKLVATSAETRKKIIAGAGAAVTVVGIGLIIFLGSSIMPQSIADRLSNIDFQSVNVQERFYFYRDALDIIRDYPVFGTGYGGWNSIYTEYQSYLYYSTEVHNHPLQVWVESGLLGFVSYIVIWLGLAVTIFRIMLRVSSYEYRSAAWTAAVTAATICLHSLIDFSLSLGGVAIMMWACIGLVRGAEKTCLEGDDVGLAPVAGPAVRRAVGTVLAGLLVVISTSFYLAGVEEKEASAALRSGDYQAALAGFESAATYDPLNYNYRMFLAQLYANSAYQNRSPEMAAKAVASAEKAVSLNKNSIQPLWVLADIYLMARRPADAVARAEEAAANAPWKLEGYESLARVYVAAAKEYIQMGRKDNARAVLTKAVDVPRLIGAQDARLGANERRLWVRGPQLTVSENLQQLTTEAENLLKTL